MSSDMVTAEKKKYFCTKDYTDVLHSKSFSFHENNVLIHYYPTHVKGM